MKYLLTISAFFLATIIQADDDLYTNVYVVPPTFLQSSSQGSSDFDPFQKLRPKSPRKTAKGILADAGITFGKGASAIYNPATSQLIVRNTKDQMELVEAYIDSIRGGVEKQLYISVHEVAVASALSQLKTDDLIPEVYAFLSEVEKAIKQKKKEPRNLNESVSRFKNLASFREHLVTDPAILAQETEHNIQFAASPISWSKLRLIVKELKDKKGVTLHNAPTVMSRSGEAFVTQIAERRYGISAVLGADEFTVDLHAYIPEPDKALLDKTGQFDTPFSKTIYDGENAMFISHSDDDKSTRIIFIGAQIMDPAGIPIHEEGGRAAETKSTDSESKSATQPKRTPSKEETAAIKEADNLAATGLWYLSNDLFNEATLYFSEALETLPRLEILENRRSAFEKQLASAKKSADGGPEKVSLLQERMKLVVLSDLDIRDQSPLESFTVFLKILLKQNKEGLFPQTPPKLVFENAQAFKDQPITLHLKNTSLLSALEYLCKVTHSTYEIDDNAIRVTARVTKEPKDG